MESCLDHMNSILDIHALCKKVNKFRYKGLKSKPWITLASQKSISVKNSLKIFINYSDSQIKNTY